MRASQLNGLQLVTIDQDETHIVTINVQSRGSLSAHLQSLAGSTPVDLRSAFKVRGQACHVSSKTDAFVTVPVPGIALTTTFRADGNVVTPTFSGASGVARVRAAWIPPANLKVIFGCQVEPRGDDWAVNVNKCYLVACDLSKAKPGWWRLPLPNLFADGQICMGMFGNSASSLQGAVDAALGQFLDSPWNADLLGDMAHIKNMFRFDSATMNPLPPATEWHTNCSLVNNALFSRFII